jgi:hypothetical protein
MGRSDLTSKERSPLGPAGEICRKFSEQEPDQVEEKMSFLFRQAFYYGIFLRSRFPYESAENVNAGM